jgi:hypothetical protein
VLPLPESDWMGLGAPSGSFALKVNPSKFFINRLKNTTSNTKDTAMALKNKIKKFLKPIVPRECFF